MTTRIAANNRIITAICKHIVSHEALASACKGIRIDESADAGIVISALEVVEPGIYVQSALSNGRWCGGERPECGLSGRGVKII